MGRLEAVFTKTCPRMLREDMESRTQTWFFLSFMFFSTHLSSAADTISSGQSLTSNHTLVSKGGNFELGFFTPGNSLNSYIGIWYRKASLQNKTYVWVANRDTPVTDPTSSKLNFLNDGNLGLVDQSGIVWSTNSSFSSMNSSQAVLGDDGNFVLRNGVRPSDVFWQSFDYPTDTFLPGGRIRYDYRTKKSQVLTSWKNQNDPSMGLYSLELDPNANQYVVMWNWTQTYWTSGAWNGKIFSGVPEMRTTYIFNFSYVKNENECYITYSLYNTSIFSRLVMDISGQIKQFTFNEETKNWFLFWSQPRQRCEVYAVCGSFGVCNEINVPVCQCLNGFVPRFPVDWYRLDFSNGGCVRRICGDKDSFSLMSNAKFPVNGISLAVASAEECKLACLNNCSCTAYGYRSGCSIWNGDLSGLQQLSNGDGGSDLYLRLAASEFQTSGAKNKGANTGLIVGAVVGAVFVLVLIVSYIYLKKPPIWKGNILVNNQDIGKTKESKEGDLELPLFELVTIAAATNNFSLSNKIGEGGFGSVYKGVLPTGQEIAIKRLSRSSRQGLEEFMNEVVLIAKLQHRNLVKLLGCCIEGDERILVYEYMPNKSLDSFIFDKTRGSTLNWKMRFNIIIGIIRGLLYLHQDSRLRIIHRDLKASNILLDSQMNPKISDFGMARTFGGDQTEENTRRVVGTYGYMSPEYATDGLFSMKSDVFSFGVLILEIVSGKRNRLFHHADHDHNLLGHAWKLMNEDKALELMDESIKDLDSVSEVLKCIQVSLLCVQKFSKDRPAMSSVFSMFDSEGITLPWPKEPGFYTERSPFEKDSSSLAHDNVFSGTDATVTLVEGR